MLFTWLPAPPDSTPLLLGASLHESGEGFRFSVPAHTLATLTVVLRGELIHEADGAQPQPMPSCFAGGSRQRHTRYRAGPQSRWVSVLGRADLWPRLSGQQAGAFAGCFFDPASAGLDLGPQVPALADSARRDPDLNGTQVLALAQYLMSTLGDALSRSVTPPATALLDAALVSLNERPLGDLPRLLAVSERSLQRLFRQELGVTPKFVQRLARLHHAVRLWHDETPTLPGLADLAAAAGFSDQAHLAREFRELVGAPPHHLKAEPGERLGQDDLLWALQEGATLLAPLIFGSASAAPRIAPTGH